MTIDLNYVMILNILVIIGILFMSVSGYKNGFLFKVLSCISFVVIVFVSWNVADILKGIEIIPQEWSPFFDTNLAYFFYGQMNKIFIFVALVVILSLVILIARPIAKILGELPIINTVNRIFGLIFGLVQSAIVIFVCTFILMTPLFSNGDVIVEKSLLRYVVPIQKEVVEKIAPSLVDYQMFKQINEVKNGAQDAQELQKWLNEKGFDIEEITEFLLRLQG